jgi:hypothetical protein
VLGLFLRKSLFCKKRSKNDEDVFMSWFGEDKEKKEATALEGILNSFETEVQEGSKQGKKMMSKSKVKEPSLDLLVEFLAHKNIIVRSEWEDFIQQKKRPLQVKASD